MFFSRIVFKKKNHIGIPHTLKCSARDPVRLKAQSEETESNYNYRIKIFLPNTSYLCKALSL